MPGKFLNGITCLSVLVIVSLMWINNALATSATGLRPVGAPNAQERISHSLKVDCDPVNGFFHLIDRVNVFHPGGSSSSVDFSFSDTVKFAGARWRTYPLDSKTCETSGKILLFAQFFPTRADQGLLKSPFRTVSRFLLPAMTDLSLLILYQNLFPKYQFLLISRELLSH